MNFCKFLIIITALAQDDSESEKLAEMIGAYILKNVRNTPNLIKITATMWLLSHEELYSYIEEELTKYIPNLDDFEGQELDVKSSEEIVKNVSSKYGIKIIIEILRLIRISGSVNTYIAMILSSVCLNQQTIQSLRKKAHECRKTEEFQQQIEVTS